MTRKLSTLTTDATRTERDHRPYLAATNYTRNASTPQHRTIHAYAATRSGHDTDDHSNQLNTLESVETFGRRLGSRTLRGRHWTTDKTGRRVYRYDVLLPSLQDNAVQLVPHSLFLRGQNKCEIVLKAARRRKQQAYLNWTYLRQIAPASELRLIAQHFWFWKFEFNKLSLALKPVCGNEELARSLSKLGSVAEMKERWGNISEHERLRWWPEVMLGTLWNSPENADMVLEATLSFQHDYAIAGHVAADALDYLVRRMRPDETQDRLAREHKEDRILRLAVGMLENTNQNAARLRQGLLGILANRLSAYHAASLYDVLTHTGRHLHTFTLLNFASKLGESAEHKKTAFQILQTLVERDETFFLDPDRAELVSSVITTLLRSKTPDEEAPASDFDPAGALHYFMEAGFRPNIVGLSSYLASLSKSGHSEEAFRLAILFAEEGIVLDLKGWQTVMRAAKDAGNHNNLTKGVDIGRSMSISAYSILSNTLHCVYHYAANETRNKELQRPWSFPLFLHMLRIYAMRFDLAALQWWIPESLPLLLMEGVTAEKDKFTDRTDREWDFPETIVPLAEEIFTVGPANPNELPSKKVIGTMLRAYIRSLQQPYDLVAFYSFFKSKIESRDKRSVKLVEIVRTIVHDTFILCLTEQDGFLGPALQVFADMLQGSLSDGRAGALGDGRARALGDGTQEIIATGGQDATNSSNDDQAEEAELPPHPRPSTFTYNLILRGLASQNEDELATQVYQVMKKNNVMVTRTTLNTMIKVHALSQHTNHMVQALQDLEFRGFKADRFTYNAFGKLRKQKEAIELMEMIIETNRVEAALDKRPQIMY